MVTWNYFVSVQPTVGVTVWLRLAFGCQPPIQGYRVAGTVNGWIISGWAGIQPLYVVSKWRAL